MSEVEATTQIEARIRDLLREMCGKDPPMDGDEDLFESGYLDSLLVIKYITEVEQRFGVAVSVEDLTPENFATLSATVRLVKVLSLRQR